MKIGIMGGTFDPIHLGHLFLAQEVMGAYHLDKVIFVPSKIGPHKMNSVKTTPDVRYEMVKCAIADNQHFDVSDIEIKRQGISYTIDTVRAFKRKYKSDSGYFITGADAIVGIETWREYKTLLKDINFIAATRPSLKDEDLKAEINRLNDTYDVEIQMMDMLNLEISSSDIRRRCKAGRPIKYLVPDCVEKIIMERRLYDD
ncbi:MAG: nicotinic acid mononucleotide adenylyltransferase [Clostridiales bacterium]|nr:MAG: nicotinic acid mononucleotide adenylyltransferase [Clostridiales bacterium]